MSARISWLQGGGSRARLLAALVLIAPTLFAPGCVRKATRAAPAVAPPAAPGGTEVNPQWSQTIPSVRTEWTYATMPVPEPSQRPLYRLRELNFPERASVRLNEEGRSVLREVAGHLKENPTMRVLVVGFADSVQEKARGDRLAAGRAKAVGAELLRLGVPSERLESAGFGSSMAVAPKGKPIAQESDRKVEIWVLQE